MRRALSAKPDSDPNRTPIEPVTSSPLSNNDSPVTASKLRPNRTPSPVPPLHSSHVSSDRREIAEKKSGWFGKRKSLRISEKKEFESLAPTHRADDSATTSTSSSNVSSSWLKPDQSADARSRRPSEPSLASMNPIATSRSARPKSSGDGLIANPANMSFNGRETPSGSVNSSTGSVTDAAIFPSSSAPTSTPVLHTIPARKSSLVPDAPKSPDRKKSLTSLPRIRGKSHNDNPPRPSTAPGNTESPSMASPPPPVPPMPTVLDGYALPTLEKGKMREDPASPVPPLTSGSPPTLAPGLHTFAGANNSSSSTGSTTALKRASRKLSISGQMFGFGKRDKEKKEREREERESGKGPPSFNQH
ncbi:hypothetical protein BDP27DRAFT_760195 [Rhodocollybia butyracea]|uniref:Uncharacterized protein n=1 Tax=Rhodocollybia butyracea TaxID=206335 RepID=A0A9P5P7M6_9AGAR|nr:hypothetical protein BDP27DRAFT_760195 [Rhodocollybia butyracea]